MALLELVKLTKTYGALVAVSNASVAFDAGAIHLVCGENGAGKSTLLKMGAGIEEPDEGAVTIEGKPLAPHTPAEALARGVAMVTQHFALAPALTTLENIALARRGPLRLADLRREVEKKLASLGFTLPLDRRVESLTVGEKQRTEIVRALTRDARVVVLDEPTAVLARAEVTALYGLLRKLADEGKAIVVVTHKMDEVRLFADRVTVMRKGEIVWTRDMPAKDEEAARDALVEDAVRGIMGRARTATTKPAREKGEVVLDVKRVAGLSKAAFQVRAGEIVGVAGVTGNGQTELVDALANADGDADVSVEGRPKRHGDVSFVHEDRRAMGLVLEETGADNLLLGDLARVTRRGLVDFGALRSIAKDRAARASFTRDLDVIAGSLSGGNQQKLVVGRALGRDARVLVLVEPTRGVDLGAIEEIHAHIFEAAAKGAAIVCVSSDADELRALSDRILVLAKRQIVADFAPDVSDDELGAAMLSGASS